MAALRAFLALELSPEAREAAGALAQRLRGRAGGERVRWVRAENLHVTLRFLGDVEPDALPALARAVAGETAALAPFELRLGALHAFPSPARARVVALAVEPAEPLVRLAAALERGVAACGFAPEERPFHAHLTLGRLRDGRFPDASDLPDPPPAPTRVREVVLFRSELGPGGSRYMPLERIALGGNASSPNQPD